MKEVKRLNNKKMYLESLNMLRIANQAVLKAKEENKKHGLAPNFYKNGKVYFVLPDGSLTTTRPK